MPRLISRTLIATSIVLAAAACGYDVGTSFNADGSVSVSLKFLFPTALMNGTSPSSGSVTGLSPADIDKASKELATKYPGAKVTAVTEGEESGAQVTIPFKTEKDAFAFMTQPSKLSPSSGSTSAGIDLSNTGGLFVSATHTKSGSGDTYTFKSQPKPISTAAPGSQEAQLDNELASVFSVTFSLTVPNEITSAPGALFTLDRKTAIWKMSLTQPQTLTATTGGGVGLTGNTVGGGQSPALLLGGGLVAIAIGFLLGMFTPVRRLVTPAASPAPAMAPPPPPPAPEPIAVGWGGPPPGTPPPAPPTG